MNKFRLHPLYDLEGAIGTESGVNDVPAAEVQSDVVETGVDNKVEAEPNNYEKAFAKRLTSEREKIEKELREKWETESAEKYKPATKAAQYLQKKYGITDETTLLKQLEEADLEEEAEREGLPASVIKERQEAARDREALKQYQTKEEQQQQYQTFRSNLEKFATEKQADANEIHQYMHDNQFPADKVELAYKTMQSDKVLAEKAEFDAKKEEFKKNAVKEYLDSKKAPKAEGKGAAGIVGQGAPGSWQAADARFKARIEAANKSV
jgi:hypothetical protein